MPAVSTIVGIVGVVVAVAGAVTSTVRSNQQNKAQEKALKYQASVDRNNAIIARQQADFSGDRIRKRNRLLISKQKATYAKSGVLLEGTPEDVIFDSEIEGELDALAALYTGNIQAVSAKTRAELNESGAKNLANAKGLNTASGILSGAGTAASASANLASRIENRTTNPDVG